MADELGYKDTIHQTHVVGGGAAAAVRTQSIHQTQEEEEEQEEPIVALVAASHNGGGSSLLSYLQFPMVRHHKQVLTASPGTHHLVIRWRQQQDNEKKEWRYDCQEE